MSDERPFKELSWIERFNLETKTVPPGDLIFVKLKGIDDWVGGVHLHSQSGAVWFQHENQIVRGSA
jgi:hypothetical protein